jgi:hypothetical protein
MTRLPVATRFLTECPRIRLPTERLTCRGDRTQRIGPSNRAGKYAEAVNSSLTGLGELLRDLDRIREVLFGNEYVAAFRPRRFREWRHIIAKEGGIGR